ncbi:MAG: AIPR family protein [Clostridiaceae bacterium]|nr:AIPR family protein [Clostridiaceae bacterium]
MKEFVLSAKSFKRMDDPRDKNSERTKYVCYIQACSIPQEFDEWMETNPREQKMSTNVADKIKESLAENPFFHELNRGILMSAQDVSYDNRTGEVKIVLDDPTIHGNIDGGHTLRAILDAKIGNTLSLDQYVFFEIFTGIDSPVELAAARNTSVQVDLKSIAELEKSFDVIKEVLSPLPFAERVQYKMNEHYQNDKNAEKVSVIDIREIIAIIIMFSQSIYPYKTSTGTLSETQPIQCYSGKEASLRKFLNLGSTIETAQKKNREKMIKNMSPILKDIFSLWEVIESSFASKAGDTGRRYGTRKYSKYNNGNIVGHSMLEKKQLQYIVPKGIMYPLVGSFRALVQVDAETGRYHWKKNPMTVWEEIGAKLVATILDEKVENPDVIAKNGNLWSNLFKEVYIYGYLD